MKHISIFLPFKSIFYYRIYCFLRTSFIKQGYQVTGQCGLLTNDEMNTWLNLHKPDFIFEMNRVKDEILILHEKNIFHISWIVDFQGRDETQIKGSDITYFFDPGWEENYQTGGYKAWMPPGTCTDTFFPQKVPQDYQYQFGFMGHIPNPWTKTELKRHLKNNGYSITFNDLLQEYEKELEKISGKMLTHTDLKDVIRKIMIKLIGYEIDIPRSIYYDLMERTKRIENRQNIIGLALSVSQGLIIYGSENWCLWPLYKKYYHSFMESPAEINNFHQSVRCNLHDGLSFHFRSIDCLASGGLLLHLNNSKAMDGRGLFDYFDKKNHYYEFTNENFQDVYQSAISAPYRNSSAQKEALAEVRENHSWDKRVEKIIFDVEFVR
jgi:hypothetical protein